MVSGFRCSAQFTDMEKYREHSENLGRFCPKFRDDGAHEIENVPTSHVSQRVTCLSCRARDIFGLKSKIGQGGLRAILVLVEDAVCNFANFTHHPFVR